MTNLDGTDALAIKSNKITREDIPRIFASFACFGAAFGFGAGLGVLGPSLPGLSEELQVEASDAGQVFSWRGIGALAGTFLAASILEQDLKGFSKHLIATLSIAFSAFATFLVPIVASFGNSAAFNTVKLLFLLQGMGFGMMDTFAIVAMQEMWGQRVQPWMQMKNLMSSAGTVVGPICVSSFGFNLAFKVCALTSLTSFIGIALESWYSLINKNQKLSDQLVAVELDNLASNLEAIQEELHSDRGGSLIGSIDLGSVISDSDFLEYSRVLSFATTHIVDLLDEPVSKIVDIHIVPRSISLIVAGLAFLHIGLLYTYGGWISTYTLMVDPGLSFAEAAKMSSFYSSCACISAVYAIPASFYFSTTTLLRFQLSLLVLGAVALFVPLDPVEGISVSAVLVGLAVSCIYPLIMTLANDYQMTMDARGVSFIVLGSGVGEALAPAAAGLLIAAYGRNAFPVTVVFAVFVMVSAYFYVHIALTKHSSTLSHTNISEEAKQLLSAGSIDDDQDITRPRSRSRSSTITRGWRSLSVDKYNAVEGLEAIAEGHSLVALPAGGNIQSLGTSHLSYQA